MTNEYVERQMHIKKDRQIDRSIITGSMSSKNLSAIMI